LVDFVFFFFFFQVARIHSHLCCTSGGWLLARLAAAGRTQTYVNHKFMFQRCLNCSWTTLRKSLIMSYERAATCITYLIGRSNSLATALIPKSPLRSGSVAVSQHREPFGAPSLKLDLPLWYNKLKVNVKVKTCLRSRQTGDAHSHIFIRFYCSRGAFRAVA